MPIELGLSRILKLLPATTFTWRALHVAGTNGKGSVCAYISSALNSSGIKTGRFTTPHLLDRWDSISLNESTVDSKLFFEIESLVKKRNEEKKIGASEFEVLTATAFEIFSREKVQLAVVEVGLGGRLDATNVIKDPLVTVITKIGLDHQDQLGETIEEIAREKAGILKKGTPCVVDGANSQEVVGVIREVASETEAGEVFIARPTESKIPDAAPSTIPTDPGLVEVETHAFGVQQYNPSLLGRYQHHNLACAVNALSVASRTFPEITAKTVQDGISAARWPGRLEWLKVKTSTGRPQQIFLDGAHNPEAAAALADFVNDSLRTDTHPVTWVIALTKGKNTEEILGSLLKKGDVVSTVEFSPVDGMPWVEAQDTKEVANIAKSYVGSSGLVRAWGGDLKSAMQWSCEVGCEGPIVVAGSL